MTEQKNLNAGHRNRLLQRYLKNGISSLEEHEMLELLLHFAIPYRDTKSQAKMLIAEFGGIENVLNARAQDIENMKLPYVTERAAALITLVHALQTHIETAGKQNKNYIKSHAEAGEYAVQLVKGLATEKLYIVNIGPNHRIIKSELISDGAGGSVDIILNKIISSAILHKAVEVLLIHNHPNGSANPSVEDIKNTNHIGRRLEELGIALSDHIIVAGDDYSSMRNRGFIY